MLGDADSLTCTASAFGILSPAYHQVYRVVAIRPKHLMAVTGMQLLRSLLEVLPPWVKVLSHFHSQISRLTHESVIPSILKAVPREIDLRATSAGDSTKLKCRIGSRCCP